MRSEAELKLEEPPRTQGGFPHEILPLLSVRGGDDPRNSHEKKISWRVRVGDGKFCGE